MKLSRPKSALALGLLAGLLWSSGCGKAPQMAPVANIQAGAKSTVQMALECGLSEPLVELGGALTAQESDSLQKALTAYRQHSQDPKFQGDPLAELSAFPRQYPRSPVDGSLELNLGLLYRTHGYNRRSLEALKASWDFLKGSSDPRANDLANRALGE